MAPTVYSREEAGVPPINTSTRPIGSIIGVAIHHTPQQERDGDPRDNARGIDHYHRSPRPSGNGWAGAGYHVLVEGDQLVELRDIEQVGAHEEGENDTWVGFALVGDGRVATDRDVDTFGWRVYRLEKRLGKRLRVAGHCDLPGANTECPGDPQLPEDVRAAADRYHAGGEDSDTDTDTEGWDMNEVFLFYGERGTPDYSAACALADAVGGLATNSPGRAREALRGGATVVAIGHPAATELADDRGEGDLREATGSSALGSLAAAVEAISG